MIQESRCRILNEKPEKSGTYVLYWMQQSQRTRYSHALESAIRKANQLNQPVVVCFGLMDNYPNANARSYTFLLEGLRDVQSALKKRGIKFVIQHGQPPEIALRLGKDASLIICDRGYLHHQRQWRDQVADQADCRVVEIESDVVVPVEAVTNKHEFAARTIRPKIHKLWNEYLIPFRSTDSKKSSLQLKLVSDLDISDPEKTAAKLKIDHSVKRSPIYTGGEVEASKLLTQFINQSLNNYAEGRNEPADSQTSKMSMYLHFGQVSPLELALAVKQSGKGSTNDRDSFLEELIIRRELSMNFCHFNPRYDSYDALPEWAKITLQSHQKDQRPYLYKLSELENAQTHDPYWNAAQQEMVITGFMHNYMRMYWGKKILEWTADPRKAFETTLFLNNKYEIDGRDPNSYANIAWIYGLHDRPWTQRPVFGTIRYMNAAGLERKFEIEDYVRKIDLLAMKYPT